MKKQLTQQDLINAGIGSCRTAWARGYVSRRSDPKDRHLQFTHRLKLAFVCVPSWESSCYCVRQYYNYAACIELAKKKDCLNERPRKGEKENDIKKHFRYVSFNSERNPEVNSKGENHA